MGNFINYTDIPVFAYFACCTPPDDASSFFLSNAAYSSTYNKYILPTTQASINLSPNLAANRYLGKTQVRNDFSSTGPLEAKISLTFTPLIEKVGASLTCVSRDNIINFFKTSGDTASLLKISNITYLAHLQSYSVKISAMQPISITANFVAYNPRNYSNTNTQAVCLNGLSTSFLNGISADTSSRSMAVDSTKPYFTALHALTTTMDGSTTNIPTTKTSIDINVDIQRTPVYNLGSATPSVFATSVERTTTINGEDVGSLIDITGANPGATNIYFLPMSEFGSTAAANNNVLSFDINGRIVSQELSVAQGNVLNGKVVIKEIIL